MENLTNMPAIDSLLKYAQTEMEKVNNLLLGIAKDSTTDLIKVVSDYLMNAGGKRLRPLLALVMAKAMSYKGGDHILLAGAVELIHAATLLHDDVVDESKKRRNLPPANLIWGNKTSILVGDYLFSKSFQLMIQTESLPVLSILANDSNIIAETEVWQLQVIGDLDLDIADYLRLIEGKTATLFMASCQSGMMLGNCSEDNIDAIGSFGLNLGIAFQIIDDYLDYFADETTLGKKPLQDFAEKKITLPLIALRDRLKWESSALGNNATLAYYLEPWNNVETYGQCRDGLDKAIENGDCNWILKMMNKTNVAHVVMSHAEKYGDAAIKSLERVDFGKNDHVRSDLIRLVRELLTRCN